MRVSVLEHRPKPNRWIGATMTPSSGIIPFGLCRCGCGQKTKIATQSYPKYRILRGQPQYYVNGHNRRIRPEIIEAAPFKIDGVYCRLIPLTQGQYAVVDATDYEWLMQWKWRATYNKTTRSWYASRLVHQPHGERRHKTILMHRQILGLGEGRKIQGDHICPFNTADNRRANLRIVNQSQNIKNRKKAFLAKMGVQP